MPTKLYSRNQLIQAIKDLADQLERKDPSDQVICELVTNNARYELDETVLPLYVETFRETITEKEKLYKINQDKDTGVQAYESKVNEAAEEYVRWKGHVQFGNGVPTDVSTLCLSLKDQNKANKASVPTTMPVKPYLPDSLPDPEDEQHLAHDEVNMYTEEDYDTYNDRLVGYLGKADAEKIAIIAELKRKYRDSRTQFERTKEQHREFDDQWSQLEEQRNRYKRRELLRIQHENITSAIEKMKSAL